MNVNNPLQWRCKGKDFTIQDYPLLMGIVNVTPDSFSDGGQHFNTDDAIRRAFEVEKEGADIIDIGGESTRPGAETVDEEEEIRRVIPVIEALSGRVSCPISIDTMKAEVAQQAVKAGASIINDVSGLSHDPDMPGVAAEYGVGVIVMHMKGEPGTMQQSPTYSDVVKEVGNWLQEQVAALQNRGIAFESIAVDPGIGFGKSLSHNIQILNSVDSFKALNRPVMIGLSRKSFLGKITGKETGQRLASSIAASAFCILRGVHIIRAHDVKESRDAIDTLRTISKFEEN